MKTELEQHEREVGSTDIEAWYPYMKKGGMYFIEDVFDASFLKKHLGRDRVERLTSMKRGNKLLLIRC